MSVTSNNQLTNFTRTAAGRSPVNLHPPKNEPSGKASACRVRRSQEPQLGSWSWAGAAQAVSVSPPLPISQGILTHGRPSARASMARRSDRRAIPWHRRPRRAIEAGGRSLNFIRINRPRRPGRLGKESTPGEIRSPHVLNGQPTSHSPHPIEKKTGYRLELCVTEL